MPRKRKCWSWKTGERGATVRVFERKAGGALYIGVPTAKGGYRRVSLGHRDRERAKCEARGVSAQRFAGAEVTSELTVARLFAMYLPTVRGKQSYRDQVRRAAEMWTRFLGPQYKVTRVGPREWDTFIAKRGSGEIDCKGNAIADAATRKPVGATCVAYDLGVLRAACRRATVERTTAGRFVLQADPTRGLSMPTEKNPARPTADHHRFERTLAKVGRIEPKEPWKGEMLRLLLWLASDTGRRISSILALRWSDWSPEVGTHGVLRFRADADKVGREWWTPVTPELRRELESFRKAHPGVGNTLIFPSPYDPQAPLHRITVTGWLRRAERLADLPKLKGGSWHPYRRRWASERKHLPLTDVAAAGGWKDTSTITRCYQTPDVETMERVITMPRRLKRIAQ
jgi:integrase